jgi:hypothetical protein
VENKTEIYTFSDMINANPDPNVLDTHALPAWNIEKELILQMATDDPKTCL